MLKFVIHQIGPVKHVEFVLNKFNVLIGPQSSGKSTIAKIISFCLWLEKDVLMHRNCMHVDRSYIEKRCLEYYKLKNYLNPGYSITFEGDVIRLLYNEEKCEVGLTPGFEQCKVGKIAYIPAERNSISLPNIASLKMPDISTRDFIFDWLEIHQKFQRENAVGLLQLKLKYYYEEDSKKDMIILEDGKEISLEEASSGLQSVVPLYVYMNYLTHWVFEHLEDISFDKKEKIDEAVMNELAKEFFDLDGKSLSEKTISNLSSKAIRNILQHLLETLRNSKEQFADGEITAKKILSLEENISHPHYSNIILEEPELNLFPETQKDLLYDILGMISRGRDRVVMTTHSPYLLYALNNCMLGFLVHENIPEEDVDMDFVRKSAIDPKDVSVWEIKDGSFLPYKENPSATIQDAKGLIRANYFDRIMKNIMADFSSLMNYYDED